MSEISNQSAAKEGEQKRLLQGIPAPLGKSPQMIANYQISGVLGVGATAVVYSAENTRNGDGVALKIPLPDVLLDSQRRARFECEAKMLAKLKHPNLVQVHEVGVSDPVPFIAMERCEDSDLGHWLERLIAGGHPLPDWKEVVELVTTVAEAVDYVHQQGITHRDLKPANILLNEMVCEDSKSENLTPELSQTLPRLSQFEIKVSDFGLSKSTDLALTQTRSSMLVGTPLYMAPEQVDWRQEKAVNQQNSTAADVYSLGAILYQLLTGRTPIQGQHYYEVLERTRNPRIKPLSQLRSDLPQPVLKRLETICSICLQRNPQARYQSAGGLAADLRRCLSDEPVEGHSIGWVKSGDFWISSINWFPVVGWFAIACSALVAFWLLFTSIGAGVYSIAEDAELRSLYSQALTLFLTSMIPMALVGWGCLKEMRLAVIVGILLNSFNLIAGILGMLGRPLMFQEVYFNQDGYFCFTIHLFIFLIYASLQLLLMAALISSRK